MKIGILGVGHLAEYLVRGARMGVEFVLSPGSGDKAARLAEAASLCGGGKQSGGGGSVRDGAGVSACGDGACGVAGFAVSRGPVGVFGDGGGFVAALDGSGGPGEGVLHDDAGVCQCVLGRAVLLYPGDAEWEAFLGQLGPVHRFARMQRRLRRRRCLARCRGRRSICCGI